MTFAVTNPDPTPQGQRSATTITRRQEEQIEQLKEIIRNGTEPGQKKYPIRDAWVSNYAICRKTREEFLASAENIPRLNGWVAKVDDVKKLVHYVLNETLQIPGTGPNPIRELTNEQKEVLECALVAIAMVECKAEQNTDLTKFRLRMFPQGKSGSGMWQITKPAVDYVKLHYHMNPRFDELGINFSGEYPNIRDPMVSAIFGTRYFVGRLNEEMTKHPKMQIHELLRDVANLYNRGNPYDINADYQNKVQKNFYALLNFYNLDAVGNVANYNDATLPPRPVMTRSRPR